MSNVIILLSLFGDNAPKTNPNTNASPNQAETSCNHISTAFKPTNRVIKLAGDLFTIVHQC